MGMLFVSITSIYWVHLMDFNQAENSMISYSVITLSISIINS
mgnify:CR=1 FL=1